ARAPLLFYHRAMALFRSRAPAASDSTPIAVRPATENDAAAVVRLARGLSMTDGGRPSRLTEAAYRRDGFGEGPAFRVLVAEADGLIIGYALYFPGYDTDRATRGVYLADLYVDEIYRRRGI